MDQSAPQGQQYYQQPPPPPYYQQPYAPGPPPANVYGPMMYPPVAAPAPIIINTNMAQAATATAVAAPTTQIITIRRQTNHALCCLICVLTGGMNIPCWIYACITDD